MQANDVTLLNTNNNLRIALPPRKQRRDIGSWEIFYSAMQVQSAVLRSHIVCPSVRLCVCLSVTLVNCDHISWNSSELILPLVSLGCSLSLQTQTSMVFRVRGTPGNFGQK